MKKRLKKSYQTVLTIIAITLCILICSIEDFSLSSIPFIVGMIVTEGLTLNVLNKYGR